MLFKNLYNWIKFKSLPTSYVFKNRLFIERDTKQRKIINNFGLVFRNSLWGNFELNNIQKSFKKKYLRIFKKVIIFFFIFCLCIYKKYFNQLPVVSAFYFTIWNSLDSFTYWSTFSVWFLLFIYYTSIHWFASYFLDSYFFLRYNTVNPLESNFFEKYHEELKTDIPTIILSDQEMKYVLYNWLCSDNKALEKKVNTFFFSTKKQKMIWKKFYLYFIKLYKVVYLFNLTNNKNNLFSNKSLFFKKIHSKNNRQFWNTKYFKIHMWLSMKNTLSCFSNYSTKITTKYLTHVIQRQDFYSVSKFQNKNINSNVYFNILNFNLFNDFTSNSEWLLNFNEIIKNQINTAKWNRWLYRYSVLHRRLLKNSNKISNTKKLLHSGLFDKNVLKRNAWLSGKAKKLSSTIGKNIFKTRNIFSTLTLQNNQLVNFDNKNKNFANFDKYAMLSFYENSFFWYNKRFFFFNSITTNIMNSSNYQRIMSSNDSLYHTNMIVYLDFIDKLTSSFLINFVEFSFKYNKFNFSKKSNNNNYNYNSKNLNILLDDSELLTIENLDVLQFLLSNTSNAHHRPFFTFGNLNYFKNSNHCCDFSPKLITFKNLSAQNIDLDNLDIIFINDLLRWNYFL